MSEEMAAYVTGSAPSGTSARPARENGRPKGLLPLSWINRPIRFEFVDASGTGQSVQGVLLDFYPAGCIFAMNGGARTLIVWERLCLLELVES